MQSGTKCMDTKPLLCVLKMHAFSFCIQASNFFSPANYCIVNTGNKANNTEAYIEMN